MIDWLKESEKGGLERYQMAGDEADQQHEVWLEGQLKLIATFDHAISLVDKLLRDLDEYDD